MNLNKSEILVLVRNGVLGVECQDSDGRSYIDNWTGTKEELHTALATRGYKRIGAAKGSDIGGVYVRVA